MCVCVFYLRPNRRFLVFWRFRSLFDERTKPIVPEVDFIWTQWRTSPYGQQHLLARPLCSGFVRRLAVRRLASGLLGVAVVGGQSAPRLAPVVQLEKRERREELAGAQLGPWGFGRLLFLRNTCGLYLRLATHSFVFMGEEEDEPLDFTDFSFVTSGILC